MTESVDTDTEPPPGRIPRIGGLRFTDPGSRDCVASSAAQAVERRVVRRKGPEVPVAAFQSSI